MKKFIILHAIQGSYPKDYSGVKKIGLNTKKIDRFFELPTPIDIAELPSSVLNKITDMDPHDIGGSRVILDSSDGIKEYDVLESTDAILSQIYSCS